MTQLIFEINRKFRVTCIYSTLCNFGDDLCVHRTNIVHKLTTHRVWHNGIFASLTAAHSDIGVSNAKKKFVICEGIDLMILRECPSGSMLNISKSAALRDGDSAVAVGMTFPTEVEQQYNWWTGRLMGKVSLSQTQSGQCLNGSASAIVLKDEYIIDGRQLHGMSGGGCLNGYGYLGMVHAIEQGGGGGGSPQAIVLPSERIKLCLERHRAELPNESKCCSNGQCPHIIQPPTMSFLS